ncbi:hypothetical protein, partial [Klebsiella pneumoniae]|uniref:hypothetical protein n=1 Tax=Klebsiella pneumoniae TaxID=573 RepID=UPI001953A77E
AYPTPAECRYHRLARHDEDVVDALERVADELGATAQTEPVRPAAGRSRPTGAITPESFAAIVAAQLPEQAIV